MNPKGHPTQYDDQDARHVNLNRGYGGFIFFIYLFIPIARFVRIHYGTEGEKPLAVGLGQLAVRRISATISLTCMRK